MVRSVHVAPVQRGEIVRSVTLPGTIRAYQEATLYAKVAGYLNTITVDKGDSVPAGALLATLEIPELNADLARDTAAMKEAELDAGRLRDARTKAPNLVTPQAVDESRAKAAMATATVERDRTLLGYTRITAPFAGIISHRWADAGAFIPAATSGSTPQSSALVTLTDISRVRVQVPVPESEVRFVSDGATASFSVEGLPGREFRGQVTRYSHVVDDATKTMLTEIEVANGDGALKPGMYASVRLAVEHKADALLVPLDSLLQEKAKASVFTVVDGKARKTPVKLGFVDATRAEVLEGLDASASVILLAKQPMDDNQPVVVSTEVQ
jgi:RND family efflux transporter MFP subunit